MADKQRTATPADARAVWDSIKKPTIQGVTARLNACGQYHTVYKQTVKRWKDRDWVPSKSTNTRKPEPERAQARSDEAAPAMTGDPTSTVNDIIATIPKAEAEGLRKQDDRTLFQTATREALIAAIIVSRRIADNPEIILMAPKEFGSLHEALAGSALSYSRMLTPPDLEPKLIEGTAEHDPFEDVMAEIAKASYGAG